MQATRKRSLSLLAPVLGCWLAASAGLGACQKDAPPEAAPAKPPAPAPVPRPPPPPLPLGAVPERGGEHVPDAGAEPARPLASGDWSENTKYKFRFDGIEACGAATQPLGPSRSPSGPAGQFRGETSWVGARITIHAKVPELIISARDIELSRGGVILRSRYIDPPVLARCQPLLPTKQLLPDENIEGFAVFEVPKSFRENKQGKPIVLSYRPTRWGGAKRVEIPIPDCFDACAGADSAIQKEKQKRSPSRRNQ
jgi:hypothetical protein